MRDVAPNHLFGGCHRMDCRLYGGVAIWRRIPGVHCRRESGNDSRLSDLDRPDQLMLTISGVEVGGNNPCRFVCEISNNHGGSIGRAFRLIDAAKAANADFVKFQAYRPSELVALRGDGSAPEPWGSQGFSMSALYAKAQTPLEWFPDLAAHCKKIDMPWFSSVFGLEGLVVLEKCGCPAYKVARLDNTHSDLIAAIVSRGKPVLVSRSPFPEITTSSGFKVERFEDERWNQEKNVWQLWCPVGYPSPAADVHLPDRFTDRCYYKGDIGVIGLSSHCMNPDLPIAAVARGCKLIEMHMQLAEETSELEASVSLTQYQFADMVRRVREVEVLLG